MAHYSKIYNKANYSKDLPWKACRELRSTNSFKQAAAETH